MSISVFTLSILFFLVVRFMMEVERKRKDSSLDDIYNMKKKKKDSSLNNSLTKGNKAVQSANAFSSSPSSDKPMRSLDRSGY